MTISGAGSISDPASISFLDSFAARQVSATFAGFGAQGHMAKIHIHEDDEGMRNLYPVAAQGEASDDLSAAQASGEKNRAPEGLGWTDVHAITEPAMSFRALNRSFAEIAEAIGREMPRLRQFEVGFGEGNPFHHTDDDAYCYGYGRHLYLKLDVDGDRLTAIWYDASTSDDEELLGLRRAVQAIDRIEPVMIADYWLNQGGAVGDPSFLNGYFASLKASAIPPAPEVPEIERSPFALVATFFRVLLRTGGR